MSSMQEPRVDLLDDEDVAAHLGRLVVPVRREPHRRLAAEDRAPRVDHQRDGRRVTERAGLRRHPVVGGVEVDHALREVRADGAVRLDPAAQFRVAHAHEAVDVRRHLPERDAGAEHDVGGVDVVAEVELGPRAAVLAIAVRRPADPDHRRVGLGDVGGEQQRAGHVGERSEERDEEGTGIRPPRLLDDQPRTGAVDRLGGRRQRPAAPVRDPDGVRRSISSRSRSSSARESSIDVCERWLPKWAGMMPRMSSVGESSACTTANWSSASFFTSELMRTRRVRGSSMITLGTVARRGGGRGGFIRHFTPDAAAEPARSDRRSSRIRPRVYGDPPTVLRRSRTA